MEPKHYSSKRPEDLKKMGLEAARDYIMLKATEDTLDLAHTLRLEGHQVGWDNLETFRKALIVLTRAVDLAQQKCVPQNPQPPTD